MPPTPFFYVHQQPERMLFPSLTVHEAFYALLAGRHGGFWNMRRPPSFEVLMDGLPASLRQNLARYAEYEVSNLSGGYRALVAVSAAAVAFPDCGLLLDEPSAGLDADKRIDLAQQLVAMAAVRSTPVVVSTHQRDFAEALGGVKLSVHDGTVMPAEEGE
jgi:ABC-type multidrug transport system ATPase subunit